MDLAPVGAIRRGCGGLKLPGHNTVGARAPFALAGLAAVLVFYRLTRRYIGGWQIAAISALLLVANGCWILHARQYRYYALSSLLLFADCGGLPALAGALALGCAGISGSRVVLVPADYGTVWPVFGVLFLCSVAQRRRTVRETLLAAAVLAAGRFRNVAEFSGMIQSIQRFPHGWSFCLVDSFERRAGPRRVHCHRLRRRIRGA